MEEYLELIRVFRDSYRANLPHWDDSLERRICRLTPMLLLARIDGKSPAEYFTDEAGKELVRQFVYQILLAKVDQFDEFDALWRKMVAAR